MSQPYDQPLFGEPDPPKPQRELSKKDLDDAANKIVWTRYKIAGVQCSDCVIEHTRSNGWAQITAASWMRVQGQDKRVLCYRHKAEWLARGDRG